MPAPAGGASGGVVTRRRTACAGEPADLIGSQWRDVGIDTTLHAVEPIHSSLLIVDPGDRQPALRDESGQAAGPVVDPEPAPFCQQVSDVTADDVMDCTPYRTSKPEPRSVAVPAA